MVEELIWFLGEQKSLYKFKRFDFEADKEFGPVSEKEIEDELTAAEIVKAKIQREEEKIATRAGYVRIKAKAKEIHENYGKAVTEGQRSGSGRLVCDHWEELKAL